MTDKLFVNQTHITGFNCEYAPINWTINDNGDTGDVIFSPYGNTGTSGDVLTLQQIKSNPPQLASPLTYSACITTSPDYSSTIGFDYAYGNLANSVGSFGYIINGVPTQLVGQPANNGSGSTSFTVGPSTNFCFYFTSTFNVEAAIPFVDFNFSLDHPCMLGQVEVQNLPPLTITNNTVVGPATIMLTVPEGKSALYYNLVGGGGGGGAGGPTPGPSAGGGGGGGGQLVSGIQLVSFNQTFTVSIGGGGAGGVGANGTDGDPSILSSVNVITADGGGGGAVGTADGGAGGFGGGMGGGGGGSDLGSGGLGGGGY